MEGGRRYRGGSARLVPYGTTHTIFSVDANVSSCRISGIAIDGRSAAGSALHGLVSHGTACLFEDLRFDGFERSAIRLGGVASKLDSIFVQNACLKSVGDLDVFGAVKIGGSDHYVVNVEATAGGLERTRHSGARRYVAFDVEGTSNFLTSCVGEISDVGFYVRGLSNRLLSCRADKNYGEGYYLGGRGNQLIGCTSFDNSVLDYSQVHVKAATKDARALLGYGLFDGYHIADPEAVLVGCIDLGHVVNRSRYGFYGENGLAFRGALSGCVAFGNAIGPFGGLFTKLADG